MSDNGQLKREFTDDERRRLVDYFSLLIEIDKQESTLRKLSVNVNNS